jgi:hypothetical protein
MGVQSGIRVRITKPDSTLEKRTPGQDRNPSYEKITTEGLLLPDGNMARK